jgi:four helix bundle protein
MELTVRVYRASQRFPTHELYGLSAQLRRAAVSVANIAEGKGRCSDKELLQFLSRARGSLYEVETQLEITGALGYLSPPDREDLARLAESVGKMLSGMTASFRHATQELPA